MNSRQDLQPNDINDVPDIAPIELPDRNINPSFEERLLTVENVLDISN